MRILFRISKTMDEEAGWNDGYEHRIVRMSEMCRSMCQVRIGDRIHLRLKDGSLMAYHVEKAFTEDLNQPHPAYVTSITYKRLLLSSSGKQDVQLVDGITLGCDPEFFLFDRNTSNVISANRFVRKYGHLGNDGMLMELRPNPSVHVEVVIEHIRRLFAQCRQMLNKRPEGPQIGMLAASSFKGLTAGFHLHYGVPRSLLGRQSQVKTVATLMTRASDYYIGIPATVAEGDEDNRRRTSKFVAYGKPGGFRLDNRTFEYRLPGGSLLRHPTLSAGLMSLGAVVVEDIVSRIRVCTDCFTRLSEMASGRDLLELYPGLTETHEIFKIICNPSSFMARSYLPTIIEDVRKMVGYERRAEPIEKFFRCLIEEVKYSYNIEENWGGPQNEKQHGQMVFL